MTAQAVRTERILLGPMVTPLARRRPQIVARQTTTLDHLSGGRLVLGVGLGLDRSGNELSSFGEELDDRTRAEMLDEALEVVSALWTGERVHHAGAHYRAEDVAFRPPPVQQPRIPVWVGARWPYQRPLRRAARWDGLFVIDTEGPQDLSQALRVVRDERGSLDDYAVACVGSPTDDPRPWREAGATWWLVDPFTTTRDAVRRVVTAGPPTRT
jgi:alkanesulfonate monooxygenase SsuD/methylene tetrahydromethanopterin reductase-like flavin-dependent oxidoreductase (luciferase family)